MAEVLTQGAHLLHKYGTNELKILTFEIDDTSMAINISKVVRLLSFKDYEINSMSAIKADHFEGEISVRGELITVINLITYLGYPMTKDLSDCMGIITEFDGQKVAFIVSAISHNITVSWEDVLSTEHPIVDASIVNGYILKNERLILFLDFETVRDRVMGICYNLDSLTHSHFDKTMTMLYAEDSTSVRRIVLHALNEANINVILCENGQQAWDTFQEDPTKIDIILSDIEMPQKDGTSLTADIRAHPNGKDIPIILMSSMTIKQNIDQYLSTGANAFVPKNSMETLSDTIVNLLKEHSVQK